MMMVRKFATATTPKTVITPTSFRFFKEWNWSTVKKSENTATLNKSVQTIVKELEHTSSTDAQGPAPKFK
ncbi:Uncharacterised protein [Legionella wadsworthii]|uniref:Uncharacterized protein n=1 Tax=Legionella wadsworthii TaxID=28088 RepID=A0A378LSJ5_9GAMM|nr:hypothetical protein [Legionella wadsworthii]STY28828.1 Uncharacterised protein [Legionella wadsworthii]